MIIILDLDDTLYDERTYVESGIRAVAQFGYERFGWKPELSFDFMINVLNEEGRGAIFDRWLERHNKNTKTLIKACISKYRLHRPKLTLHFEAHHLLSMIVGYNKYIVTDGNKIVQQKKIEALQLDVMFERIFITHRYGVHHAKPSIYCFEKIREIERCTWNKVFYIGDNPAKDFVNLNPLWVQTVRVLTGVHKHVRAKPGYEAKYVIPNLKYFFSILENMRS